MTFATALNSLIAWINIRVCVIIQQSNQVIKKHSAIFIIVHPLLLLLLGGCCGCRQRLQYLPSFFFWYHTRIVSSWIKRIDGARVRIMYCIFFFFFVFSSICWLFVFTVCHFIWDYISWTAMMMMMMRDSMRMNGKNTNLFSAFRYGVFDFCTHENYIKRITFIAIQHQWHLDFDINTI